MTETLVEDTEEAQEQVSAEEISEEIERFIQASYEEYLPSIAKPGETSSEAAYALQMLTRAVNDATVASNKLIEAHHRMETE